MRYICLPLTAFPDWMKEFVKSPYPCAVNSLPLKGKLIIAPSETSEFDDSCLGEDVPYVITHPGHKGGTILIFEDGITLFAFDRKPQGYKKPIVEYLVSRGINAEVKGNDILCDGHKVAGDMQMLLEDIGYYFYGIHISINVDTDIINKVCVKPMEKIPRGLSYYGVTRKDILNALHIPDNQ